MRSSTTVKGTRIPPQCTRLAGVCGDPTEQTVRPKSRDASAGLSASAVSVEADERGRVLRRLALGAVVPLEPANRSLALSFRAANPERDTGTW